MKTGRKLLLLLLILLLCWIWGNSMVPTAMSRQISNAFKNEIRPLYYALAGRLSTPAPAAVPAVEAAPTAANSTEPEKAGIIESSPDPTPTPAPVPAKPKDVRKYAHFTEFAALGMLSTLFALTFGRVTVQRCINVLSFGLAVAVTDESIQILSGRGPEVSDVLLDCAGYASGFGVIALLWALHKLATLCKSLGK